MAKDSKLLVDDSQTIAEKCRLFITRIDWQLGPKKGQKIDPSCDLTKKKSISSHAAEVLPHIKKSPPPLSNTIFKVFVHRFFHDFLQCNALTSAKVFKCWFCHFLLNNWCQSRILWKGGLSGKICHVFLRINNRYWQLWKLNDVGFSVISRNFSWQDVL